MQQLRHAPSSRTQESPAGHSRAQRNRALEGERGSGTVGKEHETSTRDLRFRGEDQKDGKKSCSDASINEQQEPYSTGDSIVGGSTAQELEGTF